MRKYFVLKKNWLVALLIIAILVPATALAAELHVAPSGSDNNSGTSAKPLASLEAARDAVRKLRADGLNENITVWVHGGTYQLDKTLVFGLKDSAPTGFTTTYAAVKGQEPILSSARAISGWRKPQTPSKGLPKAAQGKVWVADVPKGDAWRFRTLFDGERMLPRARSAGFLPTKPGIKRELRWTDLNTLHFPEGTLKNWSNLQDVEIFVRPNHVWVVNYLTLASVDEKNKVAKTTVPSTYNMCALDIKHAKSSCWYENVLGVLDKPGEWVLNTETGKLYLWPRGNKPGKNINAPTLATLIRVEGKNVEALKGDIPVRGLVFKGLTLACAERDIWTNDDKGVQHDWEMWDKDNALIRFRGAEDCALVDCDLRASASGGVRIDRYGQNIRITGNNIHNLGGTAVLLCGYGPGLKDVNKGNLIQNNNIQTCSQVYWHNPGIFVWQSGENKILNNRIHDLPYDGLVLSGVRPRFFNITDPVKWTEPDVIPLNLRENMLTIRWDEVGKPQNAAEARRFAHARNNLVQDNEFHDCMQTLGDGNAIYFSCAAEGNVVNRNMVYNNPRAAQQVRFDDDQEESTVSENILVGSGIALKHNNYILNNVMIDGEIVFKKETEPGSRVEHNIVYRRGQDVTFFSKSGATNRGYEQGRADHNVYYSPNEKDGKAYIEKFRKDFGFDKNGLFADPMFVDLEHYDVRLKPGSPALKIGIKSIDLDKIGPAGDRTFARIRKQGLTSTGSGSQLETKDDAWAGHQDPNALMLAPESRVQWWKDMKFGMFIHWGAWSQTHRGRIWDMTDIKDQAEGEKFLDQYKTFNPTKFNPKQWAKLAKNAGMKYVVFTAKHHDGFSNWDTVGTNLRVTNPDCPYSKSENPDILRQVVDAFRAEGLAIGLYYSHIDWYHPDAKAFSRSNWEYDPELIDKDPAKWRRFVDFEVGQIRELLDNYGKIDILWFDISWPYAGYGQAITHPVVKEDVRNLVKFIRDKAPDILINNRGVDLYGDFFTPEQRVPEQGLPGNWEANLTVSNGGGFWYRGPDSEYKSTKELVQMLVDIASKGGNFLMNIGPRPDGTLTPQETQRLRQMGKWMKANSDSIYGTQKGVFRDLGWGRCTIKGEKMYLHVFDWPKDGVLRARGLTNKATGAYLLADPKKKALKLTQKKDDILIEVGKNALDKIDTVVVLTVEGTPDADRSIQNDFDGVITLRADEATVKGETAKFSLGHGTQRGDFISEWKSTKDSVSWNFKIRDAGRYKVSLVYASEVPGKTSVFTLSVRDKALKGESAFTGKPTRVKGSGLQHIFKERVVGMVQIAKAGMAELTIKAEKIQGPEFIKLKTVKLTLLGGKRR